MVCALNLKNKCTIRCIFISSTHKYAEWLILCISVKIEICLSAGHYASWLKAGLNDDKNFNLEMKGRVGGDFFNIHDWKSNIKK